MSGWEEIVCMLIVSVCVSPSQNFFDEVFVRTLSDGLTELFSSLPNIEDVTSGKAG